ARAASAVTRAMRRSGLPPFEDFMEEHRVIVYRFLMAAAGPAEADDCFQETFLSALRAYPTLREDSNLRAWVLTIATRKVIDMARARRFRSEEHTSELQSRVDLVCRLLLEKKKSTVL